MIEYQSINGKHLVKITKLRVFGFSNISKEEATKDLIKDIEIFFRYHIENGTLESALNNFGWIHEEQ